MRNKNFKIFSLCACLIFSQSIFGCTKAQSKEISKLLSDIQINISSILFDRIYLENKKEKLEGYEQYFHTCLEDNLVKIKNLQKFQNQIILIDKNDQLIKLYDSKISLLKKSNQEISIELLKIKAISTKIDEQLNENSLIEEKQKTTKNIVQLLNEEDFFSPTTQALHLIPVAKSFPVFKKLINEHPFLVSFVFSLSFIGFLIGFFLINQINKLLFNLRSKDLSLFLDYFKYIFPLLFFVIPINFMYDYAARNVLNSPDGLKLVNFIFRTISIYFFGLIYICFFLKKDFNKNKIINLFIKSILIIGVFNFIKILYIVFIEKTIFTQQLYLLVYSPIVSCLIIYLGFKWAFVQENSSWGKIKSLVYRIFCIGFTIIYTSYRLLANELGLSATFTTMQFMYLILICLFYYKFLYIQVNPNSFFNTKQLLYIKRLKQKFLERPNQHVFEKKLFFISINLLVFYLFIYSLFNFFDVEKYYFYTLHNIIYKNLIIGSLRFSINNLILTSFFFSTVILSGIAISSHLISKYPHKHKNYSFMMNINFTRSLLKLICLVISLLILGISANHLVILIGSVGVGIGFGLQYIAENLFCGLIIFLKKKFLIGDNLRILAPSSGNYIEGKIIDILFLETKLLDSKNSEVIIIPNSTLLKGAVVIPRKQ